MLAMTVLVIAVTLALPVYGQDAPVADGLPAVFSADEVVYDETLAIIVARGNVEIIYENRVLRADTVTYNQRTETITASGNVTLIEESGDVMFAEYAELDGDLANGFAREVALLLADDSRLAANGGVRRNATDTEVERAVYSPCALCPENPRSAPLWQIRAAKVTHSSETKDIVYRDAFIDFFGVPVAYTPYLSHPDPTVKRRSGFLNPSFGSSSVIGPFLTTTYYQDIAPDQDATFSLTATGDAGFVLGGEYRKRFEDGALQFSGSVNRSDRVEDTSLGEVTRENALRFHLFGNAQYELSDHWRAGLDLQRTSDDTYLETFDISSEDVLESRAYVEGFYGLNYLSAEAFAFQDLRSDGVEQPLVAPLATWDARSEPGEFFGGQWLARADYLGIVRDGDDDPLSRTDLEDIDVQRASLDGGWQRTFYDDSGIVSDLFGGMRGDLYWVDDIPDETGLTTNGDAEFASRLYPRASATARYPMVRQGRSFQQLIEPIAAFTAASDLSNNSDVIPNNDSVDLSFDEINLFSANRFDGIDRVETGIRFTYGLTLGLFGNNGGASTLFLGQSYRFDDGNDDEFPDGSGLEDQWSDLVGRFTVAPNEYINLDWRFRVDQESFSERRHEIRAIGGIPELQVGATYTFIDAIANSDTDEDTEEIVLGASSRFADYWTARASLSRDLDAGENRLASIGLTYQDECFTLTADLQRQFTEDRDVSRGTTIFFTIGLRNLVDVPLDVDGGGLFGG